MKKSSTPTPTHSSTVRLSNILRCVRRSRCLPLRPILHFKMAASDLRSSPPRQMLHGRLMTLSSSPSFPDVQELIAKKPKAQVLRSGSAAAPIPANATKAFTSASDLLRATRALGDDSFDSIDEPAPPVVKELPVKRVRKAVKESKAPRTKRAPKRVAKEVIVLSSDGATPDSDLQDGLVSAEGRKQDVDAADGRELQGTPLKAKPWRKFKAPAETGQTDAGERSVEPGKETAKAKARKRQDKSEAGSRRCSEETSVTEKSTTTKIRPRISTPEPINLELAVQRRTDWTPPRPDTSFPGTGLIDPSVELSTPADEDAGIDAANLFKTLRDTYGHKASDAGVPVAPKQQQSTKVLGKRKVIEMVAVNQSLTSPKISRNTSPAKEKAAKKKARTLTELAMAPYAPRIEAVGELRKEDSLLDYFGVDELEADASNRTAAKGKSRATKLAKSKKKAAPKQPILLSPQAAMRQSAALDFVFGTSSQLAREQSPTLLKDLHEALRASMTAEEDDPFASPMAGERLEKKKMGRDLWSVSARDEGGEMVDIEIIDLVDSPAFPEDDAILDPWKHLSPETAGAGTETADSSVIELNSRPVATSEDKSLQPLVPKSHFYTTQRKITVNATVADSTNSTTDAFPLITDLLHEDEMPPPSNQQQTQDDVRELPSTSVASVEKPRPKYDLFTDAKLAKEISRFGFKAVKSRSGMIALLDQCWKSKNEAPAGAASFSTSALAASPKRKQVASTAASTPSPAKKPRGRPKKVTVVEDIDGKCVAENSPPQKKRGRPRKDTAATEKPAPSMPPPPLPPQTASTPKGRKKAATHPARDVLDPELGSEIETVLSSPQQPFSPADADVSISEDMETSLNLSPTAQQSGLFSHITKAVTSAPRTTDPANPTWYEKMLMYDPIILEDLTAWLNSGQLTKLGHDGEVSPADVKKWCESRSICCLWRVNLHGKERKRF